MQDIDEKEILRWLGLSKQQYDVLIAVYQLQKENKRTNPSNIIKEYSRVSGRKIKSNNVFIILKALLNKNLLVKQDPAEYVVNLGGFKATWREKEKSIEDELKRLKKTSFDMEEMLGRNIINKTESSVTYQGFDEGFKKTTEIIKNCNTLYLETAWPRISQPLEFVQLVGGIEYWMTLIERAVNTNELKILYQTSLEAKQLFFFIYKATGSYHKAHEMVSTSINKLQELVETCSNIDFRYTKKRYSTYLLIPEADQPPNELVIRPYDPIGLDTSNKELFGRIYIKSPTCAGHMKEVFLEEFKSSEKLDKKTAPAILKKIQKEIDYIYGKKK